jgi:hypothetical protein
MERNLPIGIAHNVEVSIVLKPEECHYFSNHQGKYLWNKAKVWVGNKFLRGILAWRRWRAAVYRKSHPLPAAPDCANRPLGGAASVGG